MVTFLASPSFAFNMTSVVLGYWNMRGLAQSIRTVLEYVGVDYQDKRYDFIVDDIHNLKQLVKNWADDRDHSPLIIGGENEEPLAFPNLPYYIETGSDGSKLKLTQSLAIIKLIARRNGLFAETEEDEAIMEMLEQQVMDLRTAFGTYCYGGPTASVKYPNYPSDIREKELIHWEDVLDSKQWIMSDKLTYVDFLFWECIDWHVLLKSDILDGLPNLQAYYQRFKNLPRIKEYLESPKFKAWPLFSPWAQTFGWKR